MTTKTKRSKKSAWFYRVRGSYLPANKYGWATYIPFICYLAFSYIVGVKDVPRAWVSVLFILANWIAAYAVMVMLAISKS